MLIFRPLVRYFDFTGRATRKEYWSFFLFTWAVYFILLLLDLGFGLASEVDGWLPAGLLTSLLTYVLTIPSIAVAVRRLHDTNRHGAWVFLWGLPVLIISDLNFAHPFLNDINAFQSLPFHWSEVLAVLAGLAFFIGLAWFIVLMCLKSTPGKNRFGDPDQ